MKIETAETWPDSTSEFRPIAEAALKAQEEGKPGVRVELEGANEEQVKTELTKIRKALAKMKSIGRFEAKQEGASVFVRVSTRTPRTKTPKAPKKPATAPPKK